MSLSQVHMRSSEPLLCLAFGTAHSMPIWEKPWGPSTLMANTAAMPDGRVAARLRLCDGAAAS